MCQPLPQPPLGIPDTSDISARFSISKQNHPTGITLGQGLAQTLLYLAKILLFSHFLRLVCGLVLPFFSVTEKRVY